MKIENISKNAFYIIPSIVCDSVVFLFWIFYYKKDETKVFKTFWITPFIAISWLDKKVKLWILWINSGYCFQFNGKPFKTKIVSTNKVEIK